jgi:hypothetical protein
MKLAITTISLFISILCFSQGKEIFRTVVIDSGKNEFKLQAKKDTANYSKAFRILTNQVTQNPKDAELRYFLGYTIDRLNADFGNGIFQLKSDMTIRASEQFEEVNRLAPIYKGEIIILDPYAKLSSIWGSLAQAYMNRKEIDSAKWAFSEGKKRGGFIEPILEFNRQLLDGCDKNAILITYGDNITIPIWYLQTIENYRTDITIVDANLVNTVWYPKYLKEEKDLKISFSNAFIDTVEYQLWQPDQVSIINSMDTTQKFSWELRPTYMGEYILKGDKILLNILQQNFYSRPIYFNNNSDSSYNLYLSHYLRDEGLINRLTTKIFDYKSDGFQVSKNLNRFNIENLKTEDIAKSMDAIIILNGFRWALLRNIFRLMENSNYDKANELTDILVQRFDKGKLPFTSVEVEQYYTDFLQQVNRSPGKK